jgi:putative transposase
MARPLRIAYPGAFYHVTSRGSELKYVFKSHKDREGVSSMWPRQSWRYGAVVHIWYLMHNHDHLLLKTPSGNLA